MTPQEKAARAQRNSKLKQKYGITLDDYWRMHDGQAGLCAICGAEESENKVLAVDHCHGTGRVRGLLCARCNRGLDAVVAYLSSCGTLEP